MAKAKTKDDQDDTIAIRPVQRARMDIVVVGTMPLLMNRLSEKAKHELLLPAAKKNRAERAMTLKHQPYQEYRDSVYRFREDDAPTRLTMPGGAFRKAIASAALDIPGATKAEIGRLVRVDDYNVPIYGVPQISLMIVRQAGINRTPDVRTRAILPQWGCRLSLLFATPRLKDAVVYNLAVAAGDWIGVGDGRNEKGSSLSCGCFRVTDESDKEWQQILAAGGRAKQDAALLNPVAFDPDSEDLLTWFDLEIRRRDGMAPSVAPAAAKKAGRGKRLAAQDAAANGESDGVSQAT